MAVAIRQRLALSAVVVLLCAACSEDSNMATSPRGLQPRTPAFEHAGADLYTINSTDTTEACVTYAGCRDLSDSEFDQISEIAVYLSAHSNQECKATGSRLSQMLVNNKVKVGNQSLNYSLYAYGIPPGTPTSYEYIIYTPVILGGIWENRGNVIHEGFHARGFVSYNPNRAQRELLNESTYEPMAYQHQNDCANPW